MKFSRFKKFMNTCSPVFDTVDFMGSGEPFLHPQFLDFVEHAWKKRKFVSCGTNGMLIKSTEKIVRSGLHKLYINIDGVTPAQHRKYRVGADLQRILDNIERLRQAKIKLRWPFPKNIYVHFNK